MWPNNIRVWCIAVDSIAAICSVVTLQWKRIWTRNGFGSIYCGHAFRLFTKHGKRRRIGPKRHTQHSLTILWRDFMAVSSCRAFNCRILYDHYLPTVILIVILIIIGIPSPTHSLTPGLNPSFSANPPYRSLSFFSFRIHNMDFPYCLLLLLSISVF